MENETPEDCQTRFQDAQRRIARTGRSSDDLREQATGRNVVTAVKSTISADSVEKNPEAQFMIGQILWISSGTYVTAVKFC